MLRPRFKVDDYVWVIVDPDNLNNPDEPVFETSVTGLIIHISVNTCDDKFKRVITYKVSDGMGEDFAVAENNIFSTREEAMRAIEKFLGLEIDKADARVKSLLRLQETLIKERNPIKH